MSFFARYIATIVPLVALDAVWIGGIARGYYGRALGFLIMDTPKIIPLLFFYPLYALAVLILAVQPAYAEGALLGALFRGALLGLAAYGAYDLTNQATISNWPLGVTLIDMAWGAFMTMTAAGIAYAVIAWRS